MAARLGIITQARMTSTRLPGKVLLALGETDLLTCHIRRLSWARELLFVATTENRSDDLVAEKSRTLQIPCFRGSENDVLSRFFFTALQYQLDIIVRVTSDCPLIDGYLIAEGLRIYKTFNNSRMYLSNGIERTYPRGFDFEIFSFELLKEAHENALTIAEREHVTPFMYQGEDKNITRHHFKRSVDKSGYRLTVDESKDYDLIKILVEKYGADKKTSEELIELMDMHPELAEINLSVEQKKFSCSNGEEGQI
jgi:spore coat polysaccharide biosynthesis protein SpsF